MNLLLDEWIAVRRRSGLTERIAPVRLTTRGDDPAVEIEAPRADFRGALYQFLIGVMQTVLAPRDLRTWRQLWETPPSEQELREAFAPFEQAFELDNAGSAFMQDFDPLNGVEIRAIERLLMDGPSENASANNLDHFNHRGIVPGVCLPCAATALFTYQINAPEGGPGFRVSVRGGGPLTTLLMPENPETSLWRKVWINVLPVAGLGYSEAESIADVLPWMGPTRTSQAGGAGDTTPETVHRLQAYWSIPQRIRLDFDAETGDCDLCGQPAEMLVRRYRTKNYGVNYTGVWLHPLSPYNYDPKGEKPPLAVKGQKGGIGYRHWLGLTLGSKEQTPDAALVVKHFIQQQERLPEAARRMRLWCFGFDMKKAKARCWYDSTLPVHLIADERQRERFAEAVADLLDVAGEAASALHACVKQAWFKRPKDRGSEPAVPQSFWQRSETEFYRMLKRLADADLERENLLTPLYRDWLIAVEKKTLELFDEWVLAAPIEEMNMKRVIEARTGLLRQLKTKGAARRLWSAVKAMEEVKA